MGCAGCLLVRPMLGAYTQTPTLLGCMQHSGCRADVCTWAGISSSSQAQMYENVNFYPDIDVYIAILFFTHYTCHTIR